MKSAPQYLMPEDCLTLDAVTPTGFIYFEYEGFGDWRPRRQLLFSNAYEAMLWARRKGLLFINHPVPVEKLTIEMFIASQCHESAWDRGVAEEGGCDWDGRAHAWETRYDDIAGKVRRTVEANKARKQASGGEMAEAA